MVGPFIFIDHMGPSKFGPSHYVDIDQHPHIGLATLTWLIQGEIMHCDSVGSEQSIKPGAVNLMIAGKGVTHTERTPKALRDGSVHIVHGYQIWIALPEDYENMEPEFHHIESRKLPKWEDENAEFTLIAGKGYGKESPVPVFSDLFMVEVRSKTRYKLETRDYLKGEIGICIVEGEIQPVNIILQKGICSFPKERIIAILKWNLKPTCFFLADDLFKRSGLLIGTLYPLVRTKSRRQGKNG